MGVYLLAFSSKLISTRRIMSSSMFTAGMTAGSSTRRVWLRGISHRRGSLAGLFGQFGQGDDRPLA